MARETNNELSLLPGFFFYPKCADGLEELSRDDRILMVENQGSYGIRLIKDDAASQTDLNCLLDNSRIPTHRRPGVKIPDFGSVPLDLREIIQLRG